MIEKKYNTRSQKKKRVQQTTSDVSGSSNKINTELPETRPNKVQKISQIEEDSVTERTESEELSSQTSYNMGSPLHFSSQEQNEDHQVIAVDQSLKVPDVKILTNRVSKSNKTKLAARAPSWVWDYIKKDKSKKKIRCDVVITKLNGNEKKCDKTFSIATSTTHLDAVEQLARSLCRHPDFQQRKDGQTLKAPLIEAYIASYLDPRFKSMSFDKEKKKEVQEMIAEMIKTNTIDTPEQTEMDRFFDGDNQSDYPLDNELEWYEQAIQMNKYHIDHPLYKTHNPLTWWSMHQKDYPNLATVCVLDLSRSIRHKSKMSRNLKNYKR
ncbi:5114_t:CDS:2 [Racocetra fulgida]|uniref:5114_t:CDS:1 n=1 Tax=Racocetra fulgida TaxID=60492 RepID=A0A9N8ZBC3_9GLOM|nr:5114_t:CDS:2 [Racocetra fulgida]